MSLFSLCRNAVTANGIRAPAQRSGVVNVASMDQRQYGVGAGRIRNDQALRLSAVFAAVDIRSNDMSVLPSYIQSRFDRQNVEHDLHDVLTLRPNDAMTRQVQDKLLEWSVLMTGNAFEWNIRDGKGRVVEQIPITGDLVRLWMDQYRRPWYVITDPVTREQFTIPNEDICHYKGPSNNGLWGVSPIEFGRNAIRTGLAAQEYNAAYYESGCHLSGALTMDGDLSGYVNDKNGKPTTVTKKDAMRAEFQKAYGGAVNAHKVAILDHGMKYQSLAPSQADMQFMEQIQATVEDIARIFGVPLYKLQSGKQSYNANEQNSIEYAKMLQPRVTQIEQERTFKLLTPAERRAGLQVKLNMRALMRADDKSRADYYSAMKHNGYTINDILRLEDMPDVPGGDVTFASLNDVPLDLYRELSINRNRGESNENQS